MDENERKNVDEMTPDEIRREIAILTNAVKSCFDIFNMAHGFTSWYASLYSGETATGDTSDDVLDELGVPNWPDDIGAAFELCLQIVRDRYDRNGEKWQVSTACVGPIYYGAMFIYGNTIMTPGFVRAKSPNLAPSKLALLALRKMAVSDE